MDRAELLAYALQLTHPDLDGWTVAEMVWTTRV